MEQWKKIGDTLLYPGNVMSVSIPLVGFGLLIGLFHYGEKDHPITYASYVLVFYVLMSLYALQITMLNVFGDGAGDGYLLNSLSGASICILVVLGALGMPTQAGALYMKSMILRIL